MCGVRAGCGPEHTFHDVHTKQEAPAVDVDHFCCLQTEGTHFLGDILTMTTSVVILNHGSNITSHLYK